MTTPLSHDSTTTSWQFFNDYACSRSNSYRVTELKQIQSDFVARGGWKSCAKVVFVTVHVTSISNIDELTGSVEAQGSCHFRWYDSSFIGSNQGQRVAAKFHDDHEGGFIIWSPGAVELELTRHPVQAQKFPHLHEGELYTHVNWKGVFGNVFNYRSFPFDVQHCSFRFVFSDGAFPSGPHYGFCFVPDYQYNPELATRNSHEWQFSVSRPTLSSWCVYEPRYSFGTENDGPLTAPCKQKIELGYTIQRKSYFHVVTTFGSTFLLTSVGLLAFFPELELGDRLGFISTLLLTVQAIKFTVNVTLPHVPYLTVLDKYFWFCTFFLVACLVTVTLLGTVLDQNDLGYCAGFAVFWILVHLELCIEIKGFVRTQLLGTLLHGEDEASIDADEVHVWSWRLFSLLVHKACTAWPRRCS